MGGAAAGSFTADGKGNITAGVMDVNGAMGTFHALPVTGSYTLSAAGQGTITLKTSQGTVSLAVIVPKAQSSSNVINATLVALPGSLVTGGGTLVNQSGMVVSSSPVNPNFGPTLNGGYVGTLAGEFGSPAVPVGGALQFVFDPTGSVTSSGQLTVNGGPVPFVGFTGAFRPVDGTTGRTTYTLSVPGQPSFSFAAYTFSTNIMQYFGGPYAAPKRGLYYLSLAPHVSNPLFAGTATQ